MDYRELRKDRTNTATVFDVYRSTTGLVITHLPTGASVGIPHHAIKREELRCFMHGMRTTTTEIVVRLVRDALRKYQSGDMVREL